MTLRGSVASFPLETIVQLLAATAKTGQLEVRSGGESGTLGFAEGRLVSAVSGDDAGDAALGAVFTIADGDFEFVPWGDPPDSNLAGDLNQLLDLAVVQRDKIVSDRQVISDDRVRFALSDRAAAQGEVRLSAEQWRALLAVNGERDLPAIAAQLRIGRFATLSMLADLVRAGIIEVREAPPGPPPGPGDGPSAGGGGGGGGGVAETPSFTAAPPARDWGATRADATPAAAVVEPVTVDQPRPAIVEPVTVVPPQPEPVVAEAPAAAPEPEPAVTAAWEDPPPIPPREERVWDEPQKTASDTSAAEARPWDAPAAARPWDAPAPEARVWDAPATDTPTWEAPAEQPPATPAWDAPVEQTRSWQPPAAPTGTERDWGLPAQDWEKSASSPADAWTMPQQAEPAPADAESAQTADPTIDERLSALSGLFGTSTAAAPPERSVWSPEEQRPATFAEPAVEQAAPVAEPEAVAPPAEQPKKKGGLFSGLFKKEEAKREDASGEPSAGVAAYAQHDGTRAAKLAAFANALLDEFNNGQYGKGRLDDRIANLLMRVDEQADPIDRPLPIVADRIDVPALERANMSERQVAPYLALLVSQIYEDAEHAFGKDKAKRGFKAVQAAVLGDVASLGTDLRLPKV